ncbi:MAG: SDR family oxidoreductase [Azospirillaceae bacterium]
MDLGLAGRRALVCAASRGLGRACAFALAREGVAVTVTARTAGPLEETAAAIREETGVEVTAVAGDITTAAGRAAALEACPEPDILVNNAGGPPPGRFEDWAEPEWRAAVEANMITPLMLIRATLGPMRSRGYGRVVNITSGAVKAPIPILGLSNGARAGLTGAVAALAREAVADGVTINGLLPGPFETDRLEATIAGGAKRAGRSVEEEREARRIANPARRFGRPEEFGAACAFLCSTHAGYITGQNLLIDGGAFPGLL